KSWHGVDSSKSVDKKKPNLSIGKKPNLSIDTSQRRKSWDRTSSPEVHKNYILKYKTLRQKPKDFDASKLKNVFENGSATENHKTLKKNPSIRNIHRTHKRGSVRRSSSMPESTFIKFQNALQQYEERHQQSIHEEKLSLITVKHGKRKCNLKVTVLEA